MMNISILTLPVLLFFAATVSAQQTADDAAVLLQLDCEFDALTAAKGADGWASFFAPNGGTVGDTSAPTIGPAAIHAEMKLVFQDTSFSLRWHPIKAEILMPGVLGYTVGRYTRTRKNKSGVLVTSTGMYTTVWKKQPDQSWKILLDTGSPDPVPEQPK